MGIIVTGTADADYLYQEGEDDTILGLGDSDTISSGNGNDSIDGGDGDDYLFDFAGDNIISGGEGDDNVLAAGGNQTVLGGAGADSIRVVTEAGHASLVDGGDGDDAILLSNSTGTLLVTGGSGIDFFLPGGPVGGLAMVTDFVAGDGGDAVDLSAVIDGLSNYGGENPLTSGHVRVVQEGADSVVEADIDGVGVLDFEAVLTLENTDASMLTAWNFRGFTFDGSALAGQVLEATVGTPDIQGSFGNDTIAGDAADNILFGDGGNDSIDGLADSDTLDGYLGNDTLNGGDGNDYLSDDYGANTLSGGDGRDTLILGGQGTSYLDGGADVDYFVGGQITGGSFFLTGGAGTDSYDLASSVQAVVITDFATGPGGDWFYFNQVRNGFTNFSDWNNPFLTGHLRLVQAGMDVRIEVDFDGSVGAAEGWALLATLQATALETIVAGNMGYDPWEGTPNGDNWIVGSLENNSLNGYGGNDTLEGDAGDDTLSGGTGDDLLWGQDGNDTLRGDDGWDSLHGFEGDDGIEGGLGNDFLLGGEGDNTLKGGDGVDSVLYLGDSFKVAVDLVHGLTVHYDRTTGEELSGDTLSSIEAAFGSAGDDTIQGSSGSNILGGEDGNDLVLGGFGNDHIEGDAGSDTLHGGEGEDTIAGEAGDDQLSGGAGSDSLDGGADNDSLSGGARWDTLKGGDGDDVLDGGLDNDRMWGGAGNDTYVVDHDGDRVYENLDEGIDTVKSSIDFALNAHVEILYLTGSAVSGTGNGLSNTLHGNGVGNVLSGGLGNDSLYGWDGDDSLSGGNDHDRLSGGNGNDTLTGGHGQDQIGGGAGADDFVFASVAINGHDHIVDFAHGIDRLVFSGTDYGFSAGHVLTAAEFTAGSTAVGTSAQFVWDAAAGKLWWDADGDGAGAAFELALISGGAVVTSNDLIFV